MKLRTLGFAGVRVLLAGVALLGGAAWAQTDGKPPEDVEKKMTAPAEEKKEGWTRALRLGATFSFSHSDNVVGAPDGSNVQLGVLLDGLLEWTRGKHIWENILKLQHTRTRTPAIDAFVKSLDNLDLQSTYYFRFSQPSWLGLFGRARAVTQVFEGYDVRTEDTVVRRFVTDTIFEDELVPAGERIVLTGGLEPFVLTNSAGLFAHPAGSERFTAKAKAGLGWQLIDMGSASFAVDDDGATPQLELRLLDDSINGGAVFDLNLAGKLAESVVWKADTSVFAELFSDSDEDVGALNLEFSGAVSVKLSKWASLDYVLNVKRLPRVLEDWQVQNGLVLTAGFNLF